MTPLRVIDPRTRQVVLFDTVGDTHDALTAGGLPLRDDGSTMKVQSFMGGWLVDGVPLNVALGQGWLEGQIDVLRPLWANGQVPRPNQQVITQPVFRMPDDIAANTQAWIEANKKKLEQHSSMSLYLIGAAAVVGLLYLRSK